MTIMSAPGKIDEMKDFADTCMSKYALSDGTVPDLINLDDLSIHDRKI